MKAWREAAEGQMEFDRLHEEDGSEASIPVDAEEGNAAFSMFGFFFIFGWISEKNPTPLIPMVLSLCMSMPIF